MGVGRILIADDEVLFLQSTAALLREHGYECECASDAHTAAELLKERRFDVLVADIQMPGNPNLELLKQNPEVAEGLPVILVTGFPSVQSAIDSIRLPVIDYLVKPFEVHELLDSISRAIVRGKTLRMTVDMRRHLSSWQTELDGLMQGGQPGRSVVSADLFFQLSIRNMVAHLTKLADLVHSVSVEDEQRSVCSLMNCPRLRTLTQAIEESVTVLDRTRDAFKSKQLGMLRRRLEQVLDATATPFDQATQSDVS